jgi:peptide/nickel transport system permease protein
MAIAPLITTPRPDEQDLLHTLQGPSGALARHRRARPRRLVALVYGARTDLRVAFLAVLFPFVIGTTLGLLAGYYGGWSTRHDAGSSTSSSRSRSTC